MADGLKSRPADMNPYCPGCGRWIVNEDRTLDVTRDPEGVWWHFPCWLTELADRPIVYPSSARRNASADEVD